MRTLAALLVLVGHCFVSHTAAAQSQDCNREDYTAGAVAGLVGIEDGVVSGVINLESSGVEAPDWRPRHDKQYHEA
jgi:hypothetical protein